MPSASEAYTPQQRPTIIVPAAVQQRVPVPAAAEPEMLTVEQLEMKLRNAAVSAPTSAVTLPVALAPASAIVASAAAKTTTAPPPGMGAPPSGMGAPPPGVEAQSPHPDGEVAQHLPPAEQAVLQQMVQRTAMVRCTGRPNFRDRRLLKGYVCVCGAAHPHDLVPYSSSLGGASTKHRAQADVALPELACSSDAEACASIGESAWPGTVYIGVPLRARSSVCLHVPPPPPRPSSVPTFTCSHSAGVPTRPGTSQGGVCAP